MPGIVKEIPYSTGNDSKHKNLLEAILVRKRYSKEAMEKNYDKWKKAEESFLAYIPEKEVDQKRRIKREQSGYPDYTTVEIPYTYATIMSAVAYWATVFMGRDPVFQVMGRHGESAEQEKAVEALMDYQKSMGRMLVPLFIWLLDGGKYGLGVIGTNWAENKEVVSRYEMVMETFMGLPVEGKFKKQKIVESIRGYEGNELFNVRPQKWFPDPRVPVKFFQKGEFCGLETTSSYNALLKRQWDENTQTGDYFNLNRLRKKGQDHLDGSGDFDIEGTDQVELPLSGRPDYDAIKDMSKYSILEMYIELIPKDWGLGSTTFPEKWVFTVADEKVIIGARPFGAYHNKFPFNVLEYEIDGYALLNRSMADVLRPMSNVLTWLFNSHFYNVRKVMNDQFIVDPSKVMMKDVTDPGAGKIIRLKPSAYGTDLASVIKQLPVTDVTQQHLKDTLVVMDFAQRVSGMNDNNMGLLDPRGRKTATEVRSSTSAGLGRQKLTAEYMSAMGWDPLATMLLQNTQQYWSLEKMFRIAGDAIKGQQNPYISVTPEAIQGFFDFVPVDGTLPVDRFAQASLWRDLMKEGMSSPIIGGEFNWVDMFSWVAQLAGLKNINRFRLSIQPDSVLAAEAAMGNIVPLGGANERNPFDRAGRDATIIPTKRGSQGNEGDSRPSQISGVGPTG